MILQDQPMLLRTEGTQDLTASLPEKKPKPQQGGVIPSHPLIHVLFKALLHGQPHPRKKEASREKPCLVLFYLRLSNEKGKNKAQREHDRPR